MPHDTPDHESQKDTKNADKSPELLEHLSYEELLQKVEEAENKATQYWERILRMQAENENALRRVERDIANAHKYALEKFASELLPIVDSLELGISSIPPDKNAAEAIIEGVKLTLKMFYNVLEKFGINQVNPVSETFDPEFQQAISVQFDPSLKPGTVISVLQKGYTLNNRLLRPALVIVSKAEEE